MQGVVVPLNEAAVIVLVPKRGALGEVPRERSPPPGLRLLQAELSRKSNQVARRRIRRFESDMPSQAVVSNSEAADWDWINAKRVTCSSTRALGVRCFVPVGTSSTSRIF